ncbi:MAG: sugar phosphate isomerase/epimerase [Candidatus Latescibacteria bacterium]|nr:sugar phosphate isomerase/epimerase [Candidatus Latescibacterota bacterium]
MPRPALSTWSIHHALGPIYSPADDNSGRLTADRDDSGALTLLEVPERMARLGILDLEICHFHFPSITPEYVSELRGKLLASGVRLFSILVDSGDITHPDERKREDQLDWIRSWIDIASDCGASHARVIAGEAEIGNTQSLDNHPAIEMSATNLSMLAQYGKDHGVQIITENFRTLTQRPAPLLEILKRCEGTVGLCADFGNYPRTSRLEDLNAILPYATSCHAKPDYLNNGTMDRTEFDRNLVAARATGFDGPYSLIFEGEGDEWAGVETIRDAVQAFI